MAKESDRNKRKLHRLFLKVSPILISKPACRWTKQELWHAIELFLKRPFDGLVNSVFYFELESKLRGERVDSSHSPPSKKRGRPKRYPDDVSTRHWEETQRVRRRIAQERGVEVGRVRYKEVAHFMAERSFSNRGLKPEDRKIRELQGRYTDYFKTLNKKRSSGKI